MDNTELDKFRCAPGLNPAGVDRILFLSDS